MSKKAIIAELTARLRHVMDRPAMYMGAATIDNAISFCCGFNCAYSAIGVTSELGLRRQATKSRGWEFSSVGGVDRMQTAGLSEEQIVQELLLIEIKMLELVAEGLED